jgi:hypothetical protein
MQHQLHPLRALHDVTSLAPMRYCQHPELNSQPATEASQRKLLHIRYTHYDPRGLSVVRANGGLKRHLFIGGLVSSSATSAASAPIDVMGVHVQMPHRHAPCLLLRKTYRVQVILVPKGRSRGTPRRLT